MPRGDGTGPRSQGPGTGRGMGSRGAKNMGTGQGPGGNCVCPSCGHKIAHQAGMPCYEIKCEKCGTNMVRE
jgi:uncharacterized protein